MRRSSACRLLLFGVVASVALSAALVEGCGRAPAAPSAAPDDKSTATDPAPRGAARTQAGQKVFSLGPHGETPVAADLVTLTPEELTQIRGQHATAAIALHYGGNDWSNAQVAGLKKQFEAMGIRVIAVTDAGFKPEKQVSDIESLLAEKPNILVSIPTDPVATAAAYRAAANQGVKLVFMDNVPRGLTAGKDYVSVVSADNYGNGVVAAELMGRALGGKGKLGLIYHAADFFVTRERYEAFKKTISTDFPAIQIVEEQGIGGPDFSGDADRAASAMLTSHRDIAGIWAVWDVPAEGVVAAARTAGRDGLVVTTCDLGENVAIDMARRGVVRGLGAQRPFDQGVVEALLAGYGLLGKPAPAYVALPALAVTRDSLLEAWRTVYHQEAPADIKSSMSRAARATATPARASVQGGIAQSSRVRFQFLRLPTAGLRSSN